MLKSSVWSLPPSAPGLAAVRARMAQRPKTGAMVLGLCAGLLNVCICVPLALLALNLFELEQLGGSAAAGLEGAGMAKLFWAAVVFAPLTETVIGQWLPIELMRRFGVRAQYCLLASAALFSFGHVLNGAGILHASMTFIGGLAFATSYLVARNFGARPAWLAAATAHACSNGLLLFVIEPLLPLP